LWWVEGCIPLEYVYFPDVFFVILLMMVTLMFMCWKYGSVIAKLIMHMKLHRARNYFSIFLC
jgi:hypothetical protein